MKILENTQNIGENNPENKYNNYKIVGLLHY